MTPKRTTLGEIAFDQEKATEDKEIVIAAVKKYEELEALGNTLMEKCAFGTDVKWREIGWNA